MFDSVIADTRRLQQRAWQQLAQEEDLPFPAEPRHLYDMRAERVITEVSRRVPFARTTGAGTMFMPDAERQLPGPVAFGQKPALLQGRRRPIGKSGGT